jgi:hypothetical protein
MSLRARTIENISEEKYTLRRVFKKIVYVTEEGGKGFM